MNEVEKVSDAIWIASDYTLPPWLRERYARAAIKAMEEATYQKMQDDIEKGNFSLSDLS
jgi:hypothetical protein